MVLIEILRLSAILFGRVLRYCVACAHSVWQMARNFGQTSALRPRTVLCLCDDGHVCERDCKRSIGTYHTGTFTQVAAAYQLILLERLGVFFFAAAGGRVPSGIEQNF